MSLLSKIKILLLTLIATWALITPTVFAQTSEATPMREPAATSCSEFFAKFNITFNNGSSTNAVAGLPQLCTPQGAISSVITVLLQFSALVAVVFLMIGGFWYLTAAGNEEQSEKGRKALTSAIIGLIVIIMAYALVRVTADILVNNLGGNGSGSSSTNSATGSGNSNTSGNSNPASGNGSTAAPQGVRLSTDSNSMFYYITDQDKQNFQSLNGGNGSNVLSQSSAISVDLNAGKVTVTINPADTQNIAQIYVDCGGNNVQTLKVQVLDGMGQSIGGDNNGIFTKSNNAWAASAPFNANLSGAASVAVLICGSQVDSVPIVNTR